MLGNIPVKNTPVLYLALEDTERRLQDRMEKLQGLPSNHLYLSTRWPRGKEGRELLRDYIEAHGLRFIIIDTLFRIRGESFNSNQYQVDYEDCNSLKELADDYGISILVLHHCNKRVSDDPLELISGTFGLSGSADTLLVLTRTRGDADAELYVEGRDVESTELALRFDLETSVGWELMGKAKDYRETRLGEQVLEVMSEAGEGNITLSYLSKMIPDSPYPSLQSCVRRLVKSGEVKQTGRGEYVINVING